MAHDIVVVGGGPGGYAVAFRAAARGLDVALVESGKVGGTCLHRGCIPSKAILHVAEVLEEVHRAGELGLRLSFDGLDGDRLASFRDGVIDGLHKGLELLVTKRCTFHAGRGRIMSPTSVEVTAEDGSATVVEGRHVVLATGSVPRSLPGVEIDGEVVQTSDQALWFRRAPRRAVVIGAGAIGMEFASMWRPMGTEVTVVEALDRVLPLEDRDSSRAVEKAFRRAGIEVLTHAPVQAVERDGDVGRVTVEVGDEQRVLEADVVLVATGRAPNTAETGARELGILDEHGFVVADGLGRTSLGTVWGAGDVLPTLALAHAAFAEGFVVADTVAQELGGGQDATAPEAVRSVDHVHTPRVTYCHPEVASVGLTEDEARDRHGGDGIAVTSYSLRANAKGLISGRPDGFVKVVARTGTDAAYGDAVIGVHVVGPHATDLIGEATLATSWEALPVELAAITHAHPTLYEAMGEAFQAAAGLAFHGH